MIKKRILEFRCKSTLPIVINVESSTFALLEVRDCRKEVRPGKEKLSTIVKSLRANNNR